MSYRYLLQRMLQMVMVLFGVTLVGFALIRLAPGDPALLLLPPEAPPELVAQVRSSMGLDRPLLTQYVAYMSQLFKGNLGWSERFHLPALVVIAKHLPLTIELSLTAMLLSAVAGMLLGVAAAYWRHTVIDSAATTMAVLAQSVPTFWLGVMLVVVFSIKLRWFPTSGTGGMRALVLPTVTLSTYLVALILRITRSSMLDTLAQDYVRTARAKGLTRFRVVIVHALRNALLPVITVLGMQLGALLGGALITETVFAWPGIGTVMLQAVFARDYALVQGIVLLSALSILLLNFTADILYIIVDPRIRLN